MRRRELLGGAGIVAALTAAVVGKKVSRALSLSVFGQSASREQCEALLARWLDHASRQQDPLVDEGDIATAEQLARAKPEFLVDLQRCEKALSADEATCGIGAPNADALERCVQ